MATTVFTPPGSDSGPAERLPASGVGGYHAPRRDRRGRGLRGRLLPANVPASRSRAQLFDDMVLEAVDEVEERAGRPLSSIEFAVEDVPPQLSPFDAHVLEDGDVPLARVMPAPSSTALPRVVVYRWPLEARSHCREELSELITEVVAEQVAALLGIDPEELLEA